MYDAVPPANQVLNDHGECDSGNTFNLGPNTYPGRVLGSTRHWDIIQLSPYLKSEWDWITAHYDRIGLEYTKDVIWDDRFEIMRNYPEHTLSTFLFGAHANGVHMDQKWYDITKRMNSKNDFIAQCELLGVPTPQTIMFDRKDEMDMNTICEQLTFPLYIKTDVSVSGRGVMRCQHIQSLSEALLFLDDDAPFQLQQEVDAVAFLNVQYRVRSGSLERYAVTQQLLSGFEHSGNCYPALCEPWDLTDPIAQYMFDHGMKDVFAFDVVVSQDHICVLECNPRYNGASYPTGIAQKLDIPSWKAITFEVSRKTLRDLSLGDLEYRRDSRCGIIVVNWGCIKQGMLGVLIAGDTASQTELEKDLMELL